MKPILNQAIAIMILTTLIISCAQKKIATVSVGAYYNMGLSFVRLDAGGKTYFDVQGRGANENECRTNAKLEVLKTLAYKGVTQGTYILPGIKTPAQENKFKPQEEAFYAQCLDNPEMIDDGRGIDNINRMAQTTLKTSVLTMKIQVGVNRTLFDNAIKQYTNAN